jgi:nucleotide-binding universal stress UspA family protein
VRESGEVILNHAMATARKAGVQAETSLLELQQVTERTADAIAREAEAWGADVIVIGTHGRRGISHLFLGSVAESITRIAPVPVLLIRRK